MSIFGKSNSQQGGSAVGVNRAARLMGRLLLWGRVLLLLLVRGIASYLNTSSQVPTTTSGVTVTVPQPAASTGTSQAQGK